MEQLRLLLRSTFGDAGSSISDLGAGGFSSPKFEQTDLSSRYTIERTLGKGGMGEVLLATDTRLKRKVAIKRVLASSSAALSRFLTEAQSIAALNHSNIVQIRDYGQDKEGPFLIMEYVDGESLQEKLQIGAMEPADAIDMVSQLCDGLGFAHERGIIHRDLKPANILLTERGDPKLTDFGLWLSKTTPTTARRWLERSLGLSTTCRRSRGETRQRSMQGRTSGAWPQRSTRWSPARVRR